MGNFLRRICAVGVLKVDENEQSWKSQVTDDQRVGKEHTLYQLVEVKVAGCSGKLLESYRKGGKEGLEKALDDGLLREYLYKRGRIIRKQDIIEWAESRGLHSEPYQAIDYPEGEACWSLEYRGTLGETALHLCFLNNSPQHTAIAAVLMTKYPAMVLDKYESIEFFGETAIHIVIVNNDINSLKFMVTVCGADIHARASGKFFLPEDSKTVISPYSDYKGYAYYGEYPLSFASSLNRKEMYEYLMYKGADPNNQDLFGNTALHMCVIHNNVDMFRTMMHPRQKDKPNPNIRNKQGLTALGLACKLGRKELFDALLEMTSVVHWCYGKIECKAYPLEGLDSISKDGMPDWDSGLYIATAGTTDEHMDLMGSGIMYRLLEEKWKLFAKRMFYVRFMFAALYLTILSVTVYTRPYSVRVFEYPAVADKVRIGSEICTVLLALIYIITEMRLTCSYGARAFFRSMFDDAGKSCFQISCVLIVIAVPFHFLYVEIETGLLIIAVPLAWSYLLFFFRGLGTIGPFIDMIYKMLAGDMSRFFIIYVVFLVGLTQGFYHVMKGAKDSDGTDLKGFEDEAHAMMTSIHMTFGEFDYYAFNSSKYPVLARIIFFYFMALVTILLLNMLIAMMANTYQEISDRSEKEWRRQWAHIILVLERSMRPSELMKIQDQYTVNMDSSNSLEKRSRGIMVIKKVKSEHRAIKRQIAMANWKIVGVGAARKKLRQQAESSYRLRGGKVSPAVV